MRFLVMINFPAEVINVKLNAVGYNVSDYAWQGLIRIVEMKINLPTDRCIPDDCLRWMSLHFERENSCLVWDHNVEALTRIVNIAWYVNLWLKSEVMNAFIISFKFFEVSQCFEWKPRVKKKVLKERFHYSVFISAQNFCKV